MDLCVIWNLGRVRGVFTQMTRREIAFLLIGLGFGLLMSLAVTLEIFISLQRGSSISSYGNDKVALIVPILLLLTGIVLLGYRKREAQKLP
jgi:hypothetical protein